MSSTHVHLPSLNRLKEIVEEEGIEEIINRFSCYEFLVGSTESIDYLKEIYNKYKEE